MIYSFALGFCSLMLILGAGRRLVHWVEFQLVQIAPDIWNKIFLKTILVVYDDGNSHHNFFT
jgi:hypothetical protein